MVMVNKLLFFLLIVHSHYLWLIIWRFLLI